MANSLSSKSVRFNEDVKPSNMPRLSSPSFKKKGEQRHDTTRKKKFSGTTSKVCPERASVFIKKRVLSRVFSEDYESDRATKKILDPRGPIINQWNKIFMVACLVSLFVDPLFFYLPKATKDQCLDVSVPIEVALSLVRTVADVFYFIQIFVRFRTAYIAPSSRVFGRGELVVDPSKIASRYLSRAFWFDLVAALPLPQFLIWMVIPFLKGSRMSNTKNLLRICIMLQYVPRLFLVYPLSSQIVNATGVMTETAWAGAAYNLLLYMLASHVLGASWHLLSIERQEACWKEACKLQQDPYSCRYTYMDCRSKDLRDSWMNTPSGSSTIKLSVLCNPDSGFYPFGIYAEAVQSKIMSLPFIQKYFYCFWWGLKNLSSLGQNFTTSVYVGEIIFAIVIAILGLVLFGLLIGNMQSYLQSINARIEEWRIKKTDTEKWMRHRQLPLEVRQSVRRYDQYRWVATRGVDEEAILHSLPMDLRREIKRHLCLDLVRRVPLFDQMDERMLDAICERLKPALFTQATCLIRELDMVSEMFFIIRGHLDSHTTNGGRTGFFNSCRIGPGDFCGEELLTWALDPRPTAPLPSSTRTVKAVTEVEAFALVADDLKFVAAQFRRLHSKQLRHKFRFYSHQWRTWAACFIQAAWRHQRRRRVSMELRYSLEYQEKPVGWTMSFPNSYGKKEDADAPSKNRVVNDCSSRSHEVTQSSMAATVEARRMEHSVNTTITSSANALTTKSGPFAPISESRAEPGTKKDSGCVARGGETSRIRRSRTTKSLVLSSLKKPREPDFSSVDEEDH